MHDLFHDGEFLNDLNDQNRIEYKPLANFHKHWHNPSTSVAYFCLHSGYPNFSVFLLRIHNHSEGVSHLLAPKLWAYLLRILWRIEWCYKEKGGPVTTDFSALPVNSKRTFRRDSCIMYISSNSITGSFLRRAWIRVREGCNSIHHFRKFD